jgi:hypothetical protein
MTCGDYPKGQPPDPQRRDGYSQNGLAHDRQIPIEESLRSHRSIDSGGGILAEDEPGAP